MGIHFRNIRDVLQVLRDTYTYIAIQHRNDELGSKIMDRINIILKDNEED